MRLSKQTKRDIFLKTYYLKEELIEFCKDNHLPTSLSKQELTKIISDFLEGKKIHLKKKEKKFIQEMQGLIIFQQ